jgi:hypothetical protein
MRSSTLLLVSTVVSVALIVGSTLALGEAPTASSSGAEVLAWFTANSAAVRTWAWLLALFVPAFATFTALVRARLPRPHGDVFLIGSIAFLAETAVSTWIWAGLSWHADQLTPELARTLLDVASFWGPVLNGATITMLAPVVVASFGARAVVPRWVGVVGLVALIEQTTETVTIFGHSGFIAPGGPMNLLLGAGLVTLWALCLGIGLARSRPATDAAVAAVPTAG